MNLFVLAMVLITMSANTDYTIGSYRGAVIDKKPIQTVKRHCYSSRLIVCLCYLYAHSSPKLSIRAPLRSQSCREHGSGVVETTARTAAQRHMHSNLWLPEPKARRRLSERLILRHFKTPFPTRKGCCRHALFMQGIYFGFTPCWLWVQRVQVYDFIIFRGQDIKDLTVLESGKQPGAVVWQQSSCGRI